MSYFDYSFEGGLRANDPSYVPRRADDLLLQHLKAGRCCYLFNCRQMGKTSLRNRVMDVLIAEQVHCISVDLTTSGSKGVSADRWYRAFADRLHSSLLDKDGYDCPNFADWWQAHENLPPVQSLFSYIHDVLLPGCPNQQIAIFIDEIDVLLRLDFDASDFFAMIRSCYNRRGEDAEYDRLTFVLLGMATPTQLIRDPRMTPFNIGQDIELEGFTFEQAKLLAQGLVDFVDNPEAVLYEIISWTGGQPFLTQMLCRLVQESIDDSDAPPIAGEEKVWVENFIRANVIDNRDALIRTHLKTIENYITSNDQRRVRLLGIYQQILQAGEIAIDDSEDQTELRLSGLVVRQQERLRVFNRIYQMVFDRAWVEQKLSELRPYTPSFEAWITSGKQDSSRLLRGQALLEALNWKLGRSLSLSDEEFLDASQAYERRESEQTLAAEAEAKRILETANRRANQRIRVGAIVLVVAIGGTILSAILAQQQINAANKARQEQREAEEQRTGAEQKAHQAEQKYQAALKNEELAKDNQRKAEQDLRTIQQRLVTANQNANKAEQDRQTAIIRAESANAEAQKAKEQEIASKQQAEQAQKAVQIAQAKLQQANDAIKVAEDQRKIAEAGTQIERAGAIALRRFETDRTEGLLLAMRSGFKLQNYVRGKSIDQYPTLSPILALQSSLERIQETKISGNQGNVSSMSFSPDGTRLATGGRDGSIKLWDKDGKPITTIESNQDQVLSVSFSPDGNRLATGGWDGSIKIWDKDGKLITKIESNQDQVWSVSFSPDGTRLATGGRDGSTKIWDKDGKLITKIESNQGSVESVSFSPDGNRLATSGGNGSTNLWDKDGKLITKIESKQGSVKSVSFSPDGNRLATGGWDGSTKIWDKDGRLITKIESNQVSVLSVSFSPDGNRLATSGRDSSIKIWDKDGRLITTLEINQGFWNNVWSVSFSPDGNRLATTGGRDGSTKIWDKDGKPITKIESNQDQVLSMSFSLDGTRLATGGENGSIKLWDKDGKLITKIESNQGNVSSMSFSPDGTRLATGGRDGSIKLWDKDGKPITTIESNQDQVLSVSFSPDGNRLATGGWDGSIKIWDKDGKLITKIESNQDQVWSVSFSPDGNRLATGGGNGSTKIWDKDGKLITKIESNQGSVESVSFSPDGNRLATTGGRDGSTKIWNKDGKLINTIEGNQVSVLSVSFSPDGNHLATGGWDGSIKIWDKNGNQIGQFEGGRLAAISSDWKTLAIVEKPSYFGAPLPDSRPTIINLYRIDLNLDSLLRRACQRLKPYILSAPLETEQAQCEQLETAAISK